MVRWGLLVEVVVVLLQVSMRQQQLLVSADDGVGRNLKYFKSMSFPNQVGGVVVTNKAGDPAADKVRDTLIPIRCSILLFSSRIGTNRS